MVGVWVNHHHLELHGYFGDVVHVVLSILLHLLLLNLTLKEYFVTNPIPYQTLILFLNHHMSHHLLRYLECSENHFRLHCSLTNRLCLFHSVISSAAYVLSLSELRKFPKRLAELERSHSNAVYHFFYRVILCIDIEFCHLNTFLFVCFTDI